MFLGKNGNTYMMQKKDSVMGPCFKNFSNLFKEKGEVADDE